MTDDPDDVFDYDDPDPGEEDTVEEGQEEAKSEAESEEEETTEEEPEAENEGKEAQEEGSEGEEPKEEGEEKEVLPEEDPNKPPEGNEPDEQTWKLLVNGEEVELSTKEVIDKAQKAQAAEERFQEAAEYTRSARQVVDMVSKDPIETAIRLKTGMYNGDREKAEQEVYDVTVKWVTEKLKEELLPDEQRELVRKERMLKRQQEEIEHQQQVLRSEAEKREMEKAYAEADKQIAAAVEKVGLPQEPATYDSMLRVMQRNFDAGKDLTAVQAAEIVKKQLDEEVPKLLKKLSPEEIIKRDPEFLEKVREYEKQLAKKEQEARSSTQNAAMKAKSGKKKTGKTSTKARGRVGAKALNWNEAFDPDAGL